MIDSARYLKVVMWSEEDQVYVGQCPGIVGPCCHGDDEVKVYRQLCAIVAEQIADLHRDGDPLPPDTAQTDAARRIVVRIEEAPAVSARSLRP